MSDKIISIKTWKIIQPLVFEIQLAAAPYEAQERKYDKYKDLDKYSIASFYEIKGDSLGIQTLYALMSRVYLLTILSL